MTNAEWMIFRLKLHEYHRMLMRCDWKELRDLFNETMPEADQALRIEVSFTIRHFRNLLHLYSSCVEEIVRTTTDPEARLTALAALSLDDVRPSGLPDQVEQGLRDARKRVWENAVAPLRAPGGPNARN